MWRSVVALAWIGASSCDADAPPPLPPVATPMPIVPPAPAEPPPKVSTARGTMHATWSKIVTVDDCWYFSGPEGRDTRLAGDVEITRAGDHLTVAFGLAVFTGTTVNGEVTLERKTTGDFGGPWSVTETIRGTYKEGAVRAHYAYKECEAGSHCPNKCTSSAELVLAR